MLRDRFGLRTGLLMVVAAVALLVWGAALFGLGRQVGALPIGGAALPLPSLATVGEPGASVPDNEQMQARPLFASDRRPHPFVIGGNEPTRTTLRLTGVLMTPTANIATFTTDQGRSIRLRVDGDAQDGWQLLSLEPRAATLSGPSGVLNLPLQVSKGDLASGRGTPAAGTGGQAPSGSEVRSAAPANSGAPADADQVQRRPRER